MRITATLTVTIADGDEMILPPDTVIVETHGTTAVLDVDYDYGPFADPDGPDHVFVTEILRSVDGELIVERGVPCINFANPVESRTTTRL